MLTMLLIQNIVLIERCEIVFGKGLTVLTGETGAGKSILLDALGLILGMRSDARLVRAGAKQASVSASFVGHPALDALLSEMGIEPDGELIIRRILTADGKGKCFINDTPVGVAALKHLAPGLIEIHGQHEGGLLNVALHRVMLDAYGVPAKLLEEVRTAYNTWREAREALAALMAAAEAAEREREYLTHVHRELAALAPQPGEEEELAQARTRMMQGEKLAETLKDALAELQGGKGVSTLTHSAQRILARSSLAADGRFTAAIDALERAGNELAIAESEMEALLTQAAYDPRELERMEERLFALRGAARKHQVTPEGLTALLEEMRAKLALLTRQEQRTGELQREAETARKAYRAAAEKLTRQREKAAGMLEKAVAAELGSLKMPATVFAVQLSPLDESAAGEQGMDNVQFMAATNKGASLAPLHRIASGGELSRFMLALKVALAKVKTTPTMIFDEIDTGTGGAVADAIGQRLAKLGETHQVMVVTHLPQVAARAGTHLKVSKEERGAQTYTSVGTLSVKARREELARMLAGAEITKEARKAAAALLEGV